MNGILPRQVHAMELSDSLDAVHVFRSWKNVSSGILLGGLLLTQAAFWLIDLGIVAMPPASPGAVGDPAVTPGPVAQIAEESSAAGQPPAPASPLAERIFAELSYDP